MQNQNCGERIQKALEIGFNILNWEEFFQQCEVGTKITRTLKDPGIDDKGAFTGEVVFMHSDQIFIEGQYKDSVLPTILCLNKKEPQSKYNFSINS